MKRQRLRTLGRHVTQSAAVAIAVVALTTAASVSACDLEISSSEEYWSGWPSPAAPRERVINYDALDGALDGDLSEKITLSVELSGLGDLAETADIQVKWSHSSSFETVDTIQAPTGDEPWEAQFDVPEGISMLEVRAKIQPAGTYCGASLFVHVDTEPPEILAIGAINALLDYPMSSHLFTISKNPVRLGVHIRDEGFPLWAHESRRDMHDDRMGDYNRQWAFYNYEVTAFGPLTGPAEGTVDIESDSPTFQIPRDASDPDRHDGLYIVSVRVKDPIGYVSEARGRIIKVDSQPPSLVFLTPEENHEFDAFDPEMRFVVLAEDPGRPRDPELQEQVLIDPSTRSGVRHVDIELEVPLAWGPPDRSRLCRMEHFGPPLRRPGYMTRRWSCSAPLNLSVGEHTLWAVAEDHAGNQTQKRRRVRVPASIDPVWGGGWPFQGEPNDEPDQK